MTTFQDPPPQSRRSARQSERAEFAETPAEFGEYAPQAPAAEQPTSRRAAGATQETSEIAAEPLLYSTQGGPAAPFADQLPPAGYAPAPAQEPAPFRVRDYSPEGGGRRSAAPAPAPQQPPVAPGASDLDYRTQAGPAPVPPAAPVAEQTLSRRELRQRQMEAEAAAGIAPAPLQAPPEPAPVNPALLTQPPAPVNPALLTQPPAPVNPALLTQPPVASPLQAAPPPVGPPVALTQPPAPAAPSATALSSAMAEFEALTRTGQPLAAPAMPPQAEPPQGAPVQAPPPQGMPAQAAPPPTFAQQPIAPAAPAFLEPELEQTGGWVAPVGHWSRQADLDDETQPWENTITREVGVGNVATTTSALVLPEIPRANTFPTALDSTGEVLLTGSIDLPPSLSTGGVDARRYDDPNVDLMFDTQDAEFTGTDSSPVRAIRAVSTHTSARGVIHANKPHGNRMLTVVFIGTAVLAVGVVGMLIASLVLDLF